MALFPASRMLSSVFPLRRTFICLLSRLPATPILPYLHLSLETYRPLPAPVNLCRFDILQIDAVLCPQALMYRLNTEMARNHEEDVNFL